MRKLSVFCVFIASFLGATAPQADDSRQLRPWDDYRIIMWCGESASKLPPEKFPLFLQRLREMGVNTGMIHHDGDPKPWADAKFPYYVENIVNRGLCLKWNSKVRDWDAMVQEWRKTRTKDAFVREYCLDDPKWLDWAKDEMRRVARKHKDFNPVAYCIRDELSVTMSACPFDYCMCPITLAKFREWLKTQYKDLDALNKQWETNFKTWDAVMPFTTDEIKNRMASGDAMPRGQPDWQALTKLKFDPAQIRRDAQASSAKVSDLAAPPTEGLQSDAKGDLRSNNVRGQIPAHNPALTRWNFSPWCDFRTYMDISLARALDEIRKAAHDVDPHTPVGIEGTQMPSAFGGYDLWRLSQVVDWVEPYDIGNAREIFGSFMSQQESVGTDRRAVRSDDGAPGGRALPKPILTTVGESDTNHARRRLWHLLLEGDRGCIIWWSEDCIDWKSADLALTPKAKALAPVLREMQSPLAKLFLRAERIYDPIAIHYSQPSIQVDWLLESIEDGASWVRRFSSYEAEHNKMAAKRNRWLQAIQDCGFSPRFVSTADVQNEELRKVGYRVLVMVDSLVLSDKEAEQIRWFPFVEANDPQPYHKVAVVHGPLSEFDEHGRLRGRTALSELTPEVYNAMFRLPSELEGKWDEFVWDCVKHLPREVTVARKHAPTPYLAKTATYRYRLGNAKLIAIERNINWQMSEDLKQKGGNEALEKPIELEAKFAKPAHVYDLRAQKYLGQTDHITFTLDPWQPSLFALLPEKIPAEKVIETLLAK